MPTAPTFLTLTLTDGANPLHIRWSEVAWIEDTSADPIEGYMDLYLRDGTLLRCKRRDSIDKILEQMKLGS